MKYGAFCRIWGHSEIFRGILAKFGAFEGIGGGGWVPLGHFGEIWGIGAEFGGNFREFGGILRHFGGIWGI